MRNPHLFTPFIAWKGLFQHLEGLLMDAYHEFKRAHEIQIEEGGTIRSGGTTKGGVARACIST